MMNKKLIMKIAKLKDGGDSLAYSNPIWNCRWSSQLQRVFSALNRKTE